MKSGQFKLSDFDVKTIFECASPPKKIAGYYGITVSHVSKIKCKRAYTDITEGLTCGRFRGPRNQKPMPFPKRILS